MKSTSADADSALGPLTLALGLGAANLLLGATGCSTGSRYEQSTSDCIDDHSLSSAVKRRWGRTGNTSMRM